MTDRHGAARQDFKTAVNMTRRELADWLSSEESMSVGMTSGGRESQSPAEAIRSDTIPARKL